MKTIDVEARTEQAVEYFKTGYNCSQAVAMAYVDLYPVDMETIKRMAGPFGGGMGRLREVCGAVTGMFLILGLEHPLSDPDDKSSKVDTYSVVQRTALTFKEKMGSYVCADLLKIGKKPQSPRPDERNSDYYAKRPCAYCVAVAATILGNELKKSAEIAETIV